MSATQRSATGPDLGAGRRILVVDDELSISDLVATALGFVGFDTRTAASGGAALELATSYDPHLIVLDVMLPGRDGFEVCASLRDEGNQVPILFLTARDTDADKLTGLRGGGDDYLTKPFSLDELIARIEAVLRRSAPVAEAADATAVLRYADLAIDEDAHRVTRTGRSIEVSPTEFRLLRYLLINAERVVSKMQILEHVWEYDFGGDASVVETYISYLRKKVDASEPHLIQTVRGFGYVLRAEAGKADR